MKNKKYFYLILFLSTAIFCSVVHANMIGYNPFDQASYWDPFRSEILSNLLIFVFLTTIIETFFGYLFLSCSRKGALAVFVANAISYPFFFIGMSIIANGIMPTYSPANGDFGGVVLFVGEIIVVIFEALMIKKIMKDGITLRYAFLVSILLNLLSLFAGFFIPYHSFSISL